MVDKCYRAKAYLVSYPCSDELFESLKRWEEEVEERNLKWDKRKAVPPGEEDGFHKTKSARKGETKMHKIIIDYIGAALTFVIIGAGTYCLISVGSWANYQHGDQIQQAEEIVKQAEAATKRLVRGVNAMSQELIKLNDEEVTAVVIKYMQQPAS